MTHFVNEKPSLPLTPSVTIEALSRNQNDLVTQLQKILFEYGYTINSLIKGGSFSVHRNGSNQTGITADTDTKIEWTAKVFDENSEFDVSTNHRFTPTVAGKYILTSTVQVNDADDANRLWVMIFKNGTVFKRGTTAHMSFSGGLAVSVTTIVEANGASDYFESYMRHTRPAGNTINGDIDLTHFSGAWIRE